MWRQSIVAPRMNHCIYRIGAIYKVASSRIWTGNDGQEGEVVPIRSAMALWPALSATAIASLYSQSG